jgi:hypothetical protein
MYKNEVIRFILNYTDSIIGLSSEDTMGFSPEDFDERTLTR